MHWPIGPIPEINVNWTTPDPPPKVLAGSGHLAPTSLKTNRQTDGQPDGGQEPLTREPSMHVTNAYFQYLSPTRFARGADKLHIT